MATQPIDYAALAKQAGAISSSAPAAPPPVDYAALARQAGAIASTAPAPTPQAQPEVGNTPSAVYNDQTGKWEDEQPVAMDRFATDTAKPAPPPGDTGILAGAGRALKNVVTMPFSVAKDFVTPPTTPEEASVSDTGAQYGVPKAIALGLYRTLIKPQINEWQTANQYQQQADANPDTANDFENGAQHMANMHRIAAAVPIVGPMAASLAQRYVSGDKSGALTEGLGYALAPKVAEGAGELAAPAIEGAGSAAQNMGVDAMNKLVLRAGDKAMRYGHNPGESVLDSGAGTSFAWTKKGLAKKVGAARDKAGQAVGDAITNSQAVVGRNKIAGAVNQPANEAANVLLGPGGNPDAIGAIERLQQTYDPLIGPHSPEYTAVPNLWDARKNIDKNINFNRNPSQIDPAIDNIRRDQRGNVAQLISEAEPSVVAPMKKYGGLQTASELADKRVNDLPYNPFGILSLLSKAAMIPELLKGTPAKTAAATGLFQGGGLLKILADRLGAGGAEGEPGGNILGNLAQNGETANSQAPLALPPGQYEAPSTPVAGYLPETGSAGMQSVPTEINGSTPIPSYLRQPRGLPAGQYEAPSTPVAGYLPETGSAGMQSVPTEINGSTPIPSYLRQPRGLPAGQYEAPPTPVRGYLPESTGPALQSVPRDIQGTPHIPSFLRRLLPKGAYQMPASGLADIQD